MLISHENVDSITISNTSQICEGCDVEFNYVSVPLNLQYNFSKSRLGYFAEVGVTASLLRGASGNYALLQETNLDNLLITNATISDLSTSEDVNKMLLQANAALGAKYWLSPSLSIIGSYGYYIGLNSMLGSYMQKSRLSVMLIGLELKL